jgi:hypothetical protein
MAGRHQRMGADGHLHSQQDGAGQDTVERDCQTSIGHQRARAHGMMDGWMDGRYCVVTLRVPVKIYSLQAINSMKRFIHRKSSIHLSAEMTDTFLYYRQLARV